MKKWVIYKIIFPNRKSYIGLTCNFKQRIQSHRCQGSKEGRKEPLYRAIYKYKEFKVLIIYDNLTKEEAVEKEEKMISKFKTFKGKGYNASPGKLQPFKPIKYTEEEILQDALNYKTREEWRKKGKCYECSKYRGLYRKCIEHMIKKQTPYVNKLTGIIYTNEYLLEEGSKFISLKELRNSNLSVYRLLHRRKLMSQLKLKSMKHNWTRDELINEAKKYKTRQEWVKGSGTSYRYANSNLKDFSLLCLELFGKRKANKLTKANILLDVKKVISYLRVKDI